MKAKIIFLVSFACAGTSMQDEGGEQRPQYKGEGSWPEASMPVDGADLNLFVKLSLKKNSEKNKQ